MSGWSSSPTAAAIPPCAQALEETSPNFFLVTRVTFLGNREIATIRPEIPEPTTTTSDLYILSIFILLL